MQYNLAVGIIILLLLVLPLLGKSGNVIILAISVILLLRLGVLINNKTDDLLVNQYDLNLRNRELSILLDAASAVVSRTDLDHILGILADRIVNTIDCTFVKILLVADDGREAVVKAASPIRNVDWHPSIGSMIEIETDSILSKALSANEPLILEYEHIEKICADKPAERCLLGCCEQTQSLILAPIRMHDESLGLIVLGESRNPERSLSKPYGLDFITSLVTHAGMATGIVVKNARHYQLLQKAHLETIICLAEALESRDAYTRGHSDRTVEYAKELSLALGLTVEEEDRLKYAAILHDIGKIGIPDNILNKPGKLTDEEFDLMKTHPEKGADLVLKIHSLKKIAPIIRHHHERWDGTGYPDGIAGKDIPIEARIVAVLDSFDAMTSDRVYRPAPGRDFAIRELNRCAGTQFDPEVVDKFLKILSSDPLAEDHGASYAI